MFHQVYDPIAGSVVLSAAVAAGAAPRAGPPAGRASEPAVAGGDGRRGAAFALAWLAWGMPLALTVAATAHGMAFGLWPISWSS